jgi:hypothetical protein
METEISRAIRSRFMDFLLFKVTAASIVNYPRAFKWILGQGKPLPPPQHRR